MSMSVSKDNVFVVSSQYNTINKMIQMLSKDGKSVIFMFLSTESDVINCITEDCRGIGLERKITDEAMNYFIEEESKKYDYIIMHTSCIY